MDTDSNSAKEPSTRLSRSLNRTAGYVVIGGLVAGGAFAAVSGISSAGTTTAGTAVVAAVTSPATSPATSAANPEVASSTNAPWNGPAGHGRGFGGAGGTVTAINGSTLTLRTEEGIETVKTTATTTVTKERETLKVSALKVGDVVRVGADRSAGTATTTTPGTGTVTATRIAVVLPTLTGRVTAVNAGGYTLTGPNGQIVTVGTTTATRYYSGSTKTTAATVKVGTHIVAQGAQDSLTHLTADLVTVIPAADSARGGFHGPMAGGPGGRGWGGARGFANGAGPGN